MTTWHRLGSKSELLERVPFSVKVDRHSVAVFFHDGRFRAISNVCNHKGGPLCEGRVRGEFVMCPWHAWEYSVITGKGPEGFDEEQVPVFAVEERADGVYVETPPVMPRKLIKHKPSHLLEPRSEEHTSELQSQSNLVCRLLLEKKKTPQTTSDSLPLRRHGHHILLLSASHTWTCGR